MTTIRFAACAAFLTVFSTPVLAGAADACTGCHTADEFTGMSVDEIVDVVTDPTVAPHKKFAKLSEEDLRAIAAELTGAS